MTQFFRRIFAGLPLLMWLLLPPLAAQVATSSTVASVPATDGAVVGAVAPGAAPGATAEWRHGVVASLGFGYCDNVLWSAVESEGRSFVQSEIEAYLWRANRNRWEAKMAVSGEARRYLDALPSATGEQQLLALGEAAVTPLSRLRLSLAAQGFYQNQVFDLSPGLSQRFVAKLRVRGGLGTLSARVALPGGWELESSFQKRRTDFLDFTEDYTETKPGARLGWRAGTHLGASLAFFDHLRAYGDRNEMTSGGRLLPGTQLRFHQTEAEAKIVCSWDWRGRWSLTPSYGQLANRDRASGFFDYDRSQSRCGMAWEGESLRIEVELATGRYDYLVQTVGMGIEPPARVREDSSASLRVEYELSTRWQALLRYSWERSRTNEVTASYRVNTAWAGMALNL